MILLVLVVVFLATVGVQLVVKTSLFFAGFNRVDVKKIEEAGVLIEPELNSLPDATNSAHIFVASENSIVEVFVNEVKVEETPAPDGTFTLKIPLDAGENTIYVRSLDKKRVNSKDSQVYKVIYIDKNPELTIKNPADGTETDKEEIAVEGTITENAIVKINGLPTIVNTTGEFRRIVQLTNGENFITVLATDLAANFTEKKIKVIRRD